VSRRYATSKHKHYLEVDGDLISSVQSNVVQVWKSFRDCLAAVVAYCDTRKASYLLQLTKQRKISNLATRNAIQVSKMLKYRNNNSFF